MSRECPNAPSGGDGGGGSRACFKVKRVYFTFCFLFSFIYLFIYSVTKKVIYREIVPMLLLAEVEIVLVIG